MNKADIQHLIDYMYWVNHRLLDAAEQLSTDELIASTTITMRNLRATLVHELDVEWSWRLNLQGRLTDAEEDLRPEDFPDVAAIRERWTRDEAEMRAWLDQAKIGICRWRSHAFQASSDAASTPAQTGLTISASEKLLEIAPGRRRPFFSA